jgi:hypothetical protein
MSSYDGPTSAPRAIAHGAKRAGFQLPKGQVVGEPADVQFGVVITGQIAAIDEHADNSAPRPMFARWITPPTRAILFYAAAARSSLSVPRATILRASSGNGRCNAFASSHGARIQTSHSSGVVRITGIAFGWIGSTTAFGVVVRKP